MAFSREDRDDDADAGELTAGVDLGSPLRYVPLDHVYSATSKIAKPRKIVLGLCAVEDSDRIHHRRRHPPIAPRPEIVNVYTRRAKRPRHEGGSLYETLLSRADDGAPKSERRSYDFRGRSAVKRKKPSSDVKVSSDSAATKRWVSLSFDGANPQSFIGLKCKVYWPLDADWYSGRVVEYDSETNQHQVKYEDGDAEKLVLSSERVTFFISREEMRILNLTCNLTGVENKVCDYDYDEMVVLTASLDDFQEVEAYRSCYVATGGYRRSVPDVKP